MNFLQLPGRVNALLYRRQVRRLTKRELEAAQQWTMQLIRDRNPGWSEAQVQDYYDKLLDIRLVAIDQWSARLGEIRHI